MENKENTWTNYGDVNPLVHGGIFVKSDEAENGKAFAGCYHVEKVNVCPDTGKFIIDSLYVDVNDSWIDKDIVMKYSGWGKDDEYSEVAFAIDCTNYYSPLNFGEQIIKDTEQETKEYFKKMEIIL